MTDSAGTRLPTGWCVAKISEIAEVNPRLDVSAYLQVPNAIALRQSILNRAFAGQLIRSQPEDEPASVLLARISTEREQMTKRRSSRKGKRGAIAGAKA